MITKFPEFTQNPDFYLFRPDSTSLNDYLREDERVAYEKFFDEEVKRISERNKKLINQIKKRHGNDTINVLSLVGESSSIWGKIIAVIYD